MKIGKEWRIRREALEEFLKRSERPGTLVGQLRAFLRVPDNIIGIAQDLDMLHRLDSAFLQLGEAQAGLLVKFYDEEGESLDELRADLERDGLKVGGLEEEGCLRFLPESDAPNVRVETLRHILGEDDDGERSVWVSFNWVKGFELEEALSQQEELTEFVEGSRLVVKTAALERVLEEWPIPGQRQAQAVHSGAIWISEFGLALSRMAPLPPD